MQNNVFRLSLNGRDNTEKGGPFKAISRGAFTQLTKTV